MGKNLIPLDPVDVFGIQPRAEELITEEVIGYLNSVDIDTATLNDDDPLKEEYIKFLSDMNNSPIRITNEDIGIDDGRSYFDDVEFNATAHTPETLGLKITKDQMISNKTWLNGIFNSSYYPICPTYVAPMKLNQEPVVSVKMLGEVMEFVRVKHNYEPVELSSINTLKIVK